MTADPASKPAENSGSSCSSSRRRSTGRRLNPNPETTSIHLKHQSLIASHVFVELTGPSEVQRLDGMQVFFWNGCRNSHPKGPKDPIIWYSGLG